MGTAFFRPGTVAEAVAALADAGLRPAAGCTDLYPSTQQQTLPVPVLDVTGIAGLRGIADGPDGWRIGAATTWTDVIQARLPRAFDGLVAAARQVGGIQIQNAGTVGGNLCNASPAADGIPPLLTLDAEVELHSARGSRRLPLSRFLLGPRCTALRPDELLVAVHVPRAAAAGQGGFIKLGARAHLVISIAMVAARIVRSGDRIAGAALAVGSCSPVALRLPAQEAALIGRQTGEAAAAISASLIAPCLSPIDDIRADASYRGDVVPELLRRVVAGALA